MGRKGLVYTSAAICGSKRIGADEIMSLSRGQQETQRVVERVVALVIAASRLPMQRRHLPVDIEDLGHLGLELGIALLQAASSILSRQVWTTWSRLTSLTKAISRCLSSSFELTRMWRNTERASLEKKPSMVGGVEDFEELDDFAAAVAFLDQGMDVTSEQINAGHR
jgi:hypothetical protein